MDALSYPHFAYPPSPLSVQIHPPNSPPLPQDITQGWIRVGLGLGYNACGSMDFVTLALMHVYVWKVYHFVLKFPPHLMKIYINLYIHVPGAIHTLSLTLICHVKDIFFKEQCKNGGQCTSLDVFVYVP